MSRAATARLFVAVDLPQHVREELAEWARAAAGPRARGPGRATSSVRLLDPELMHVTLCFLGSRPVDEIDAIAAVLPACAGHACELSLGAPVWLPPRRPQALAIEIHDPDGELTRLQAEVARALATATGWEPERRRFRPHTTVARLRGGRGHGSREGREVPPSTSLAPTPALSFAAESLTLYRSWLGPGGARYEAIASCALVPAAG
jgi:2'-5' RNA ligase